MNSFADSSSSSDSGSKRYSLNSVSSFNQSSPPLSSTPTSASSLTMKSLQQTPKARNSSFSLYAQEFEPTSNSTTNFGYYPMTTTANDFTFSTAPSCDSRGACGGGGVGFQLPMSNMTSASLNLLNTQAQTNHLLMQRQQIWQEKQQLLQRQQELAAATVAQQQLILSATAAAKHPQDEIANSLKMFACVSACKGNEGPQSPLDEVMQEFAANGYTTDDYNRYQQYQQAASSLQKLSSPAYFPNSTNSDLSNMQPSLNSGMNNFNWLYNQHNQHQQHQQFLPDNVYNEICRQNLLQLLPVHLLRQAEIANAAAAAAAAINMDFNRNATVNKVVKRNFFKKEVPVNAKRCVFCENNKEPEDVVKSHAVRDSYGRVLCPKLRIYVCPICHASGDDAHTIKYCPKKPIVTMEDAIKAEANGGRYPRRNGGGGNEPVSAYAKQRPSAQMKV